MSYKASHTINNVRSGFHKTGTWNIHEWYPSFETLKHLFQVHGQDQGSIETLYQLFSILENKSIRIFAVPSIATSESGSLRLKVTGSVHFTSEKVLKEKDELTKARRKAVQKTSSIIYFIKGAIANEKAEDTQAGLVRLQDLKRKTVN